MSLNPGPLTLGVLNDRSVRNKGPLLVDMVASNDLDFLYLKETHIGAFDLDTPLQSITPSDFIFYTSLVPQVLVVVLVSPLDPPIDPIKLNILSTSHLRIWQCQSCFMAEPSRIIYL